MTKLLATVSIALGLLCAGSPAVSAGVAVGDELKLQFKTVGNGTLSTEQLKGKLVVLDFWATWCGPCMQLAPHMVEINEKYGSKGLQVIGVSLDNDRNALVQVTKQKGMVWPEVFDGAKPLAQQFNVNAIPFTVLVGPDSKVLYAGHPQAGLDQAIEKAFKEHPPQLVPPKVLEQARKNLADVEAKMEAGDTRGAIRLLGRIPPAAKQDGDFAAKAEQVQKKLEDAANAMLDDVQKQVNEGKYVEAVGRLKELSGALEGLPVAAKAKQLLGEVASKPEAKSAIEAADKEAKSADALEVAEKLQAQKKHELAYARYKEIVKVFPGTAAAKKAADQVRTYEKDPQFVQRAREAAAATKAKGEMKLAESYARAGRPDMARKKYQNVIDEFPGTSYAQAARDAMKGLEGQ